MMFDNTNNPLDKSLKLKKARDESGDELDVRFNYLEAAFPYYVNRKWIDVRNRRAHDFVFKNIKCIMEEIFPGCSITDDEVRAEISAFLDAITEIEGTGL